MREKLIELLEQSLSYDGTGREMRFTGSDVTPCIIANGVTVTDTNVGKWISVKDRLPEYGQPVLVCDVREDYVGMAVLQPAKRFVFSKSKDYWDWDRMECQIDEFTHWMPLPVPPKGE
jgi:hypothetical protein